MAKNDKTENPRIIIYGTGQFGQFVTRLADSKGWPIVAAFNRAGDKVGKDLGRLSGLDKDLGVLVQDCDQADYSSMDADVGIVTISDRLSQDFPAFKRLLSAGINVISHAAEAYYPYGIDRHLADEIDTLAKRHDVTFTGTGIWDMSRIWAGMLVAGPCTEIHGFYHHSITDLERVGKSLMLRGGVSLTQDQFAEAIKGADAAGGLYKTIPEHVLTALGYTVTGSDESVEPVLFDEPVYCRTLERELSPGIVCGTRIIAHVETREGVNAEARIELRLFKDGETEHMLWKVHGKPSSSVRIERDDSAHATAASLFNRIPDVIAAPPGIQLISQLGPLKPSALY